MPFSGIKSCVWFSLPDPPRSLGGLLQSNVSACALEESQEGFAGEGGTNTTNLLLSCCFLFSVCFLFCFCFQYFFYLCIPFPLSTRRVSRVLWFCRLNQSTTGAGYSQPFGFTLVSQTSSRRPCIPCSSSVFLSYF